MVEKTTKERLATIEKSIEHIDKNIDKIANNNVNQWKAINKNAQCIAGLKGSSGIISGIVSLLVAGLVAFFYGGKIK